MDTLVQVHIADIHFGAINPETQYKILYDQFIYQISQFHFDILSIDGDLFDKKFMANSTAVQYANQFVSDCAKLCERNGAAFILISGTESHEAGQLSLYYNLYTIAPRLELHIVENAKFIYTHGAKILCLPEESGKGSDYYDTLLNNSYDFCFMHGTLVGGVYGANEEDLNARRPVFSIDSFRGCKGPIIAGHVHKAMCLNSYMYYVSNPIRYKFGEEEDKGYGILITNPTGHYYKFMPIESFRYMTLDLSILGYTDPKEIVNYVDQLVANGIDHVRLITSAPIDNVTMETVSKYYSQNNLVKIDKPRGEIKSATVDTTAEILEKYKGLEFILDPNINEYEKLSRFIEFNMGSPFLKSEELKAVVLGSL